MKDKKPSRGERAGGQDLRRRVADLEADCERLELANKALQASEANWRSLTENAPDIIITADREGTILFVNHTIPGLAPEEVVGTSVYDYVSPEHQDTLKTNFERAFRTGEGATYELAGAGPHGATAWYRSRVDPIKRDGKIVGVTVITRDITEDKEAEEALRTSKQRFQEIIDNTWDIVFEVDPEGNYTFVNKAAERVTGYPLEELLRTNMRDLVAPEYLVEVFRRMTKRIRGELLSQPFDFDILHRDGHRVRLELTTTGVEKEGKLVAVQGIARDVTERKHAEDALRESEQRVRLILEHTTDGINIAKTYLETGDRRLVMCNDRYAEMAGRTREELMASEDIEEFIERRETGEEAFDRWRRLSRGLPYRGRASWIRPDGAENYYEWTAVPIRRGDDLYVVGIDRDVTQRVRAEEELRRNEEAGRHFRAQLTALHEVTIELSMTDSLDDLCRRAVELGCGKLGFDRLGLWFTTDEPGVLAGSFGIDERGNLRDERGSRVNIAGDRLADQIISKKTVVAVVEDAVIYDPEERPVGKATRVVGALWDGDDVLGYLSGDNLISGEEITPNQRELLRLYASALGHLCSRKRAEDGLRRSEEAERNFRARLTALHEVTVELAMAERFDELCRRAVELGRSRLGFDRLGTWFLDEPPNTVRGGFGTDEHGQISDERSVTGPVDEGTLMWRALTEELPFGLIDDAELLNAEGKVVGRGTLIMASLWDGERVIGCICADNLLQGKPMTPADGELLRLYASLLGHLCSRQRAEEELLVKNSAIHSAINAIALADLDGNVTYVNPSFLKLWGHDSEHEVLGRPSVSFWKAPKLAQEVARTTSAVGSWTGELTALRKDGTTFDVELSANMVADEAGQPICRMASFVDISERKRAERAMRAAQRKLTTAREEERRRLAGELHDSVGQGLIALQLTIQAALAERSESSIAEGVERTRAQCDSLVHEVRAIGRGLYPATLESMGLEAALRQLARDFESQAEVVVQWSKHCRPGMLRGDVEIALFRIGQEAVSNAVRHGKAERVELGLACPEGEAVFTVTDNGSGFDPDAARGKGLGLTTMQERAEAIGGKFDIHSRPGQTIVRVRVPAELARNPDYEG